MDVAVVFDRDPLCRVREVDLGDPSTVGVADYVAGLRLGQSGEHQQQPDSRLHGRVDLRSDELGRTDRESTPPAPGPSARRVHQVANRDHRSAHHRVAGHDEVHQRQVLGQLDEVLSWLGVRPAVEAQTADRSLVAAHPVELGTPNVRREGHVHLAASRDGQPAQGGRGLVAQRGGIGEHEPNGVRPGGEVVSQRHFGVDAVAQAPKPTAAQHLPAQSECHRLVDPERPSPQCGWERLLRRHPPTVAQVDAVVLASSTGSGRLGIPMLTSDREVAHRTAGPWATSRSERRHPIPASAG